VQGLRTGANVLSHKHDAEGGSRLVYRLFGFGKSDGVVVEREEEVSEAKRSERSL